jgi:hypothetical protein
MASDTFGPEALKLTDLDPFAVTLVGIPVLSLALIAEEIIGYTYAKAVGPQVPWFGRVPPLIASLQGSSLQRLIAVVVLVAFIGVPWFALGRATVKFLGGSYYYASVADRGCPHETDCEKMGNGWAHFHPKYGIGSLTNTPYRYQGNKTYIPVVLPSLLVFLSTLASLLSLGYLASLAGHSTRS